MAEEAAGKVDDSMPAPKGAPDFEGLNGIAKAIP